MKRPIITWFYYEHTFKNGNKRFRKKKYKFATLRDWYRFPYN